MFPLRKTSAIGSRTDLFPLSKASSGSCENDFMTSMNSPAVSCRAGFSKTPYLFVSSLKRSSTWVSGLFAARRYALSPKSLRNFLLMLIFILSAKGLSVLRICSRTDLTGMSSPVRPSINLGYSTSSAMRMSISRPPSAVNRDMAILWMRMSECTPNKEMSHVPAP